MYHVTSSLEVMWNLDFAHVLAQGIRNTRQYAEGFYNSERVFPAVDASTGPDDNPGRVVRPRIRAADEPVPAWHHCEGCRKGHAQVLATHTRDPRYCKYHRVKTIVFGCDACNQGKNNDSPEHTLDERCRITTVDTRLGTTRRGRAPRAPRHPASVKSTQHQPGVSSTGELGLSDELEAEAGRPAQAGNSASSSSTAPSASTVPPPPDTAVPGTDSSVLDPSTATRSAVRRVRAGRGPDVDPRTRLTWTESGTGPQHDPDWSQFDVARSMRALKANNQSACERILRKLHYRWWHCAAAPMKRLLSQAGQPQQVIDLVDGIVDTCKVCRTWSKPLPEPVASVHVATTFNQQVLSLIHI